MAERGGLAMPWSQWAELDGVALAALVRKRAVHPREVARQVAAGVGRVEPRIDAVLEVFADVVAIPDADRPDRAGKLYGVPIFLKDLGSGLAGRRMEWGSRLKRGAVAAATDPMLENFLAAGLVPIGRSTTPEFGMTLDTTTNYLGRIKSTRNPWKLARSAGGSSGGSAALVAAGVTPISMASDGGGSTRIPASYCALVGLKGTRGRVPRPLHDNEAMLRTSCESALTRSVRDMAAVMDDLASVPRGGTFMKLEAPRGSYLEAIAKPPKRLKIALSTGAWGREGVCDPQVAARIHEVGRLCETLGHVVEEIADAEICDWGAMWRGYIAQWLLPRVQFRVQAEKASIDPHRLERYLTPIAYRHYVAAQRYDKWDLWNAMSDNNLVMRGFGRLLSRWDVLLTPVSAIRVPAANGPYSLLRDEDVEVWIDRLADACRYTMPGNEAGIPGISVPAGWDRDGLPIGAQFYGDWAREDVLLALAAQIERARPDWFSRCAPCHVARRA